MSDSQSGKRQPVSGERALAQVALELHVPPARVFSLCTSGELDARQDDNGKWLITAASVQRYQRKNARKSARKTGARKHGK